jgi:transposase
LKGIGLTSAWVFVCEFFGWRKFRNRREVGALAGLVPMPYQSGSSDHEQGISKAGNAWLRTMAIEIAWSWLRWQPEPVESLVPRAVRCRQSSLATGGNRCPSAQASGGTVALS